MNRKTSDLIPYVNNSRTHSDEQVNQIAASISEFGFINPVIIDGDNGIIAGHGRLLAAIKLGIEEVPIIEVSHLTEAQKKAYIIADNKLALNAGWDEQTLELEIRGLIGIDFDINLLGFNEDEIEKLLSLDDEKYTKKIESPVYNPSEEMPNISELANTKKTTALIREISKSELTDKEKTFLIHAAARHTIFDYAKIADYYAHSDPEMQIFMEKSALIIIDFDSAIENGFVKLNQKTIEQYKKDYA